jgi:hypothetical protein
MNFEKIIKLNPAWDKTHSDPNKNYGLHCVDLIFQLKGEKGAYEFVVFTGWHLPHVQERLDHKPLGEFPYLFHKPQPAYVNYHSKEKQYPEQEISNEKCPLTEGICYSDGSCSDADRVFEILVCEGSEGIWKELERLYKLRFEK